MRKTIFGPVQVVASEGARHAANRAMAAQAMVQEVGAFMTLAQTTSLLGSTGWLLGVISLILI